MEGVDLAYGAQRVTCGVLQGQWRRAPTHTGANGGAGGEASRATSPPVGAARPARRPPFSAARRTSHPFSCACQDSACAIRDQRAPRHRTSASSARAPHQGLWGWPTLPGACCARHLRSPSRADSPTSRSAVKPLAPQRALAHAAPLRAPRAAACSRVAALRRECAGGAVSERDAFARTKQPRPRNLATATACARAALARLG